ncbi:MBL fold metallo-hydrolase [Magnetovibrio blakemorei]|uniref:Hydrolase n=1 Tax=Magnetovibrio blakemorei TaxID=28181 RepID=A0A1E5Q460_9PROT|nr:MBL fold metallo-hydrolase [Magnetovibrio blakemorei]OEJ64665.1 hydrolase [Magnetovibrio blakemorei]
MRITVLGSGSSTGTPSVEAGWGKCDPKNPKNRRTRPSILVEDQIEGVSKSVLVDTSPDLREQLLRHEIKHLDGVVYTHAHADHLHGIDDLRGINRLMNAPIEAFADAGTIASIQRRFGYVLEPLSPEATMFYKTTLNMHAFHHGEAFNAGGLEVTAIEQDHAYMTTFGLRFGDFAYTTDLISMHEDGFELLKGIKVWMLGTFAATLHPTHLDVETALAWCERVKPERAYFTHLGFGLDFETLQAKLPKNIFVAYDGLTIEV